MRWRKALITTGLGLLGATGAYRALSPITRGRGAILMFHSVSPEPQEPFAPNQLLRVTPAFLDVVIRRLRQLDFDIVSMDDALPLIQAETPPRRRFAVLTFDDGFRDNLQYALPILERHAAPATFYIATGFADRTARLWWLELEEAIRRADRLTVTIGGERVDVPAQGGPAKLKAFETLYWRLRRGPEDELLRVIGDLCRDLHISSTDLVERYCLSWDGVETLARSPHVTIGAHTVSHPMLAKHDDARVRAELVEGKATLEQRLGQPIKHFAYPVGDPTSAGRREYDIAAEAGFASAVTTRPGLIYAGHRAHTTSLPRVSMNGNHQSIRALDVLLSGAPFMVWNRGRRVSAA